MLWWYFKQEWKNNWDHSHFNQFQMAASTVLIQQVPFSFSRYRSLAYILMSRYFLFKFALPFSLTRTYKRLVQPYRGFLRICRYSKTFLRTFITHMHIQPLPRSRDAATIAEYWSLTERRFRHLERTVLGRYLLSCHTVTCGKSLAPLWFLTPTLSWTSPWKLIGNQYSSNSRSRGSR